MVHAERDFHRFPSLWVQQESWNPYTNEEQPHTTDSLSLKQFYIYTANHYNICKSTPPNSWAIALKFIIMVMHSRDSQMPTIQGSIAQLQCKVHVQRSQLHVVWEHISTHSINNSQRFLFICWEMMDSLSTWVNRYNNTDCLQTKKCTTYRPANSSKN